MGLDSILHSYPLDQPEGAWQMNGSDFITVLVVFFVVFIFTMLLLLVIEGIRNRG